MTRRSGAAQARQAVLVRRLVLRQHQQVLDAMRQTLVVALGPGRPGTVEPQLEPLDQAAMAIAGQLYLN